MNPVGVQDPCYPPGYVEGIHSMTGSVTLTIDCNTVEVTSLAFSGDILSWATAYQWLVQPGDPATGYNTGRNTEQWDIRSVSRRELGF